MPRLFVALDLPDAHKDTLAALRDDALPCRWSRPVQYHLTLRFIGEVDETQTAAIEKALATIKATPFTVKGHGLGVFPSRRKPRVLFAAIEATPRLAMLHRQVDNTLGTLGVEPQDKPFRPHITLARFRQANAEAVRAYLQAHQGFTLAPFEVSGFALYESLLRPDGARHKRRATIALES